MVERRADNKLVLDTQYIPPMLHVARQRDPRRRYVRELHGLLHQRGEALAARLAQPGRGGVAEIADFLLLEAVNRNEPLFAQLRQTLGAAPGGPLRTSASALAGDLATFREQRRPADVPGLPARRPGSAASGR